MCSNCGESHFVLANNHQTCVNCGTENEYTPKYYVSYSMPRQEYSGCTAENTAARRGDHFHGGGGDLDLDPANLELDTRLT